jgi:aldose sugar dehydrogenase
LQGRITFLLLSFAITTSIVVILMFGAHWVDISKKLYPLDIVFAQKQKTNISTIPGSAPVLKDNHLAVEMVATGINFPASMSFLDSDDILVTEKNTGMVKRILNGTIKKEPILTVKIENYWEGGLLGIVTDKRTIHNSNPTYVYIYYSSPRSEKKEEGDHQENQSQALDGNFLYRYEYHDGKLVNPKLVLKIPYPQKYKGIHYGGAVLVGPDKNIYLVVGDLDHLVTKAQNVKNDLPVNGSSAIFRITKQGLPAKGNPFGGDMAKYYAYGMRNSFGMDFDPITGKLWDTENGPWHGDEINLVEPGFNSGWKRVQGLSYLHNLYSKTQFDPDSLVSVDGKGKYSEPEFVSNETLGITGIKFLNSDKLGSNYENDLFVGDFNNGNVYHFDLNSERTGLSLQDKLADSMANNRDELEDVIFGQGFGAILDIEVGPDGYLYILSLYEAKDKCDIKIIYSNCYDFSSKDIQGSIFRIVPGNK